MNISPDIEGMFFLTEDGQEYRIGEDEAAPDIIPYHMLDHRLIGFTTKFGTSNINNPTGAIIEIGVITDTTNCEELKFIDPNPLQPMTADLWTGALATQT